jgi:hypothetical protein
VKTANITYYGEGPLNLQMRRFKPGKSVKARLDDILPDERRRYADRFLVVGPDGLIINIGAMVPDDVAKLVIGVNPQVLRVTGFDVRIPPGFALDDSGAEPRIVEAAVMAAKQTATAVAEQVTDPSAVDINQHYPDVKPNLTIVRDGEEPPEIPEGPSEVIGAGMGNLEDIKTLRLKTGEEPPVSMTDGLEKAVAKEIEEETIPVEEGGPTLTDEQPEEEPEPPKPAAAKKKGKKKSKVDDLLEQF